MIWKISACFMRILCESLYTFTIKCQFNEIHFELFRKIFLLCHIHMELFYKVFHIFGSITSFDSDLTQKLVQSACYETSCSYFHSFHNHAISFFSSSFLRSSYLLVLYLWLWSIHLSYGIDSSTMKILRFILDKRTMSGHRPFLDIVLG